MTRHSLFIHVATSHQRRPTGWLAPSGVAITLSLENSLGVSAKISAITPADAFFNALGPTDAAVIDCPWAALKHKTP
ncbi:hypothetical protein ACVJBD_000286 [Rhizobium mongolense]